ncbi:hypothetical protein [Falsiroseomonas sp. CW058]|uniref:hypothetical protein n=1 Tax=Falsiroseomonas sp. CW058 TaxID=3388664 RepID=UPI003D315C2A
MPFDFAAATLPPDLAPLHGVPRHLLVAHALEQLPPALRGLVAEMEVTEAGSVLHMGIEVDRIAWRAVWRRPGMPVASGSFGVWNGEPV